MSLASANAASWSPRSSTPVVRSPQSVPWWVFANPVGMFRNLLGHRTLIKQFTLREIRGRYQGSLLGMLWSFLTPLGMLLAYTFVFRFVLKARWGTAPDESALEFGLTLFAGLLVFNIASESLARAPGLILSHPNYVKKVVFPLEILPLTSVLAALAHILISLTIVCGASALATGQPGWHALWFPVILLPYVGLVLGMGWLLASLGTFLRDLGPTVALALQFLVFLTPVFYPLAAVPEPWQSLMQLNPLAVVVENSRRVLLWNQPPGFVSLGVLAVLGLVSMQLGYIWLMKSKRAFADVV